MSVDPTRALLPNLFRTEYSRLVAVLCSKFGLDQIQIAEDIVSDVFLLAAETWGKKGIPDNQSAWLYKVAQNRVLDYLRREKLRKEKVEPALRSTSPSIEKETLDFSEDRIQDSQLRMIFALCHPALDEKAQVILALKILCGFTNQEIATALLSKLETINKRLYRGKKALREQKVTLTYPAESELEGRLGTVLKVLYLLFNEGYYASQDAGGIRRDLCREAIRLCLILTSSELSHRNEAYALLALMCFHASRLDARIGPEGEWVLLDEQESNQWDRELIQRGEYYLNLAAQGQKLSKYHLEAAIAYWHTTPESPAKWAEILKYYNLLLQVEYSPIAALNRTFALSKVYGPSKAIKEAQKLALEEHFFYQVLLGYLFSQQKDSSQAKAYYQRALGLARTERERGMVTKYLEELENS